eukprot:1355782-Alexandrium_andersonii.AAC.1
MGTRAKACAHRKGERLVADVNDGGGNAIVVVVVVGVVAAFVAAMIIAGVEVAGVVAGATAAIDAYVSVAIAA